MNIAIIGSGPRGLCVAERLLHGDQSNEVRVFLFDPYGPGGKIWRMDQSELLLMNTIAQQVTLFTDETVSGPGTPWKGPTVFEWSKEQAPAFVSQTVEDPQLRSFLLEEARTLRANGHCTRIFYGIYQQWFFNELMGKFGDRIVSIHELVTNVKPEASGYFLTTTEQSFFADALVLTTGYSQNTLDGEEKTFAEWAEKKHLFYQAPGNPADTPVDLLPAREPVLLRGLGLSFFDYIVLLTVQRGGRFEENDEGTLTYIPSGKEPLIYAGSGKGLPYFPRGENQKAAGEMAEARYSNLSIVQQLQREGKLTAEEFFSRVKKDVEHIYYEKLVAQQFPEIDLFQFERDFDYLTISEVLEKYPMINEHRWDWHKIENPLEAFPDVPHEKKVREFLSKQVAEAEKGNATGAFISAIDALKDWREPIRQIVSNHWLTPEEEKTWIWDWFTGFNSFLTIGPPLIRTKQLAALIDAEIVHLLPPNLQVTTGETGFVVKKEGGEEIIAHSLIEARIPVTNVKKSKNPLIKNMLASGLAHEKEETDESLRLAERPLQVDPKTHQLIRTDGKRVKNIFVYGALVEGDDWLTAVSPRPYADDWLLRQADQIAHQLLAEK